jgi:hypothetical protein
MIHEVAMLETAMNFGVKQDEHIRKSNFGGGI